MRETELTIRACLLGAVIAIVFTAANVYLGLRVGITIASSIPAAVISMGILRAFNTGTIRENNIVQTVASAGGTLSAIIFVLPGLVMIGWWRDFPFLETFLACALGGTLGVLFSIPLRRALVVNSPLPFPEGVAAAEVLKVGARNDEAPANVIERTRGPLVVLYGALVAAFMQIATFTGVAAATFATFFRVGAGVSGFSFSYSLALIGAGHLVGLSVGMAMLVGIFLAWGVAMPYLSAGLEGDLAEIAGNIRGSQVRFIGAGTIGVAAIWSLVRLVRPVIGGMIATARAKGAAATGAREDQDMPLGIIALLSLFCLAAIGWLLFDFIAGGELESLTWPLVIGGVIFTVIIGGFIATVAGYMAGLIGASNSPVSGIGILAIVSAALLLAWFVQPVLGEGATNALIAFALFAVAIVFSIATISNDNLQDLKTGQLVGASPWRQQVALIVGVIAGALVIGPILDLIESGLWLPRRSEPRRDRRRTLGRPAGSSDLDTRARRAQRPARLESDRHRRARRHRRHCDRRGTRRAETAAPAAARRRHRHLPADGRDRAGHPWRRHRHALQRHRRARGPRRNAETLRHPARLRPHRRREPARRSERGPHRRDQQRHALRPRRRRLRRSGPDRRRPIRAAHRRELRVGEQASERKNVVVVSRSTFADHHR